MRFTLLFAPCVALAAHATPVRQVDWKNHTFGEGQAMKLVNGEWERQDPEGWTESLSLAQTLFGDLDGDGREEAVVHTVYSGGGTGRFDEVAIYQETAQEPKKIGQLPGGDRGDGGVADLKLEGGKVVLTRNGSIMGDGACCPSLELIEVWRWTPAGPHFDPATVQVRSIVEKSETWEELRQQALAALKEDPGRAAELLRSALAHKPGDALTLQELGLALMKNSDLLAIPVLHHAVAISDAKTKPATLYNLGRALLNDHKPAEAVVAFEASLKLRPDNKPTQDALAEAQAKLKAAGRPGVEAKKAP